MKRRSRRSSNGVGGYVRDNVLFSVGSQVLETPALGTIGQQGAQGLQTGARLYFPIAGTLMGARMVGRQLKKFKRRSRSLY